MAENSISSNNIVSDKEILGMYEAILPLLFDNLEKIDPVQQIKERLQAMIPFDHYHYMVKGTRGDKPARMQLNIDRDAEMSGENVVISISETFDQAVDLDYQRGLNDFHKKFGNTQAFDYYRILSKESNIRVAVGLFRCTDSAGHGGFRETEKGLLDRLTPHICMLHQMIVIQLIQQESVYYFGIFARLAGKLAEVHSLSEAEEALVLDVIFGYSNEEIAERHFVSQATVKTHINHIFKKTGTKNRVEFISKFFTSPEHVQF
jgi:DNA-binding CsgD family transcriptional regulator